MHSLALAASILPLFALVAQGAPVPDTTYADPENVVVNLEFEDQNISPWYLTSSSDMDFYMDIQQNLFADDQLTWALRVGEITTTPETEAFFKYIPSFDLEQGATYQVAFSVRSSLIVDGLVAPGLGGDFGALQMTVFNANGNAFSARLGKGQELKNEWYRFHYTFTADASAAGKPSYIGGVVHASGEGVDWWFDDISLIKV